MAELRSSGHGGGCCGMAHIFGFYDFQECDVNLLKRKVRELQNGARSRCLAIESVVTERQMKEWPLIKKGLEEAGFRRSFSFINKNSGNKCHVYHWYRGA